MGEPIWKDPVEGFRLTPDVVCVQAKHQEAKLEACGINAAVYRGVADPSFFIGIAIQAGVDSGISAEGSVNMVQSLEVIRPPRVDELLLVEGTIVSVTKVGRGERVETHVWFSDQTGKQVLRANRVSLKPTPGGEHSSGAGERPEPVINDLSTLQIKNNFQLSPKIVSTYSSEGNSIHYDVKAAKAGGLRAPIIGGGMGVHFLMADLWETKRPASFNCDIYFRRPIFWDEEVAVGVDPSYRSLGLIKLPPANSSQAARIGTEIKLIDCP